MKEGTTSARALLGADPTAPASRVVAGVPLLTSPSIAEGLSGASRGSASSSRCGDTSVTTDGSAFYTSDRTAVRAIVRVGVGFTDPAAVVKVAITP